MRLINGRLVKEAYVIVNPLSTRVSSIKTCATDLAFRAEKSFSEHCLTPIPGVAESIDRKAQRLTLKNGFTRLIGASLWLS